MFRFPDRNFIMLMRSFGLCLFMLSLCSAASAAIHADLVLLDGRIWTENPAQPEAEALAVLNGHVLEVGNSAEIKQLVGPQTKVIELRGRRVLPGFNDAHVHFYTGGVSLTCVQLRDARTPTEFRDRIAAFARSRPKGEWILNGSWDHENWNPAQLPTHELIDDVTRENPVMVNRLDGHMVLANALAMKLAGISRNTADVPGGVIVRDEKGNPTGVFKDAAMALVAQAVPLPTEDQITSAIMAAQTYALENGVTSVQDMGVFGKGGLQTTLAVLAVYQRLLKEDRLRVRIAGHLPLTEWKRFADAGIRSDFGGDKLNLGAVKGFADGSLGSSTAWFFQPFSDAPENSGIPSDDLVDPVKMFENIKGADAAGLQIAIHAIGDRANNTILNFYQKLEEQAGKRDRRLRIEHAQHLQASDIPRFGSLRVIASVQPYHCIDDGRWAEKKIGAERAQRTYAFRSLLDSGATLAFGSDWWVAPMSPLMGIYAAVTRRTLDGAHPDGWVPAQKITTKEAIHAYTVGSAYASFEEKRKGSLERNKLADLVVLSGDILTLNPIEIQNVKVDMTISDGKVVYERARS